MRSDSPAASTINGPAPAAAARRHLRPLPPPTGPEPTDAWVERVLTTLSNGLVDEAAVALQDANTDDVVVRLLITDLRCRIFASTTAELGARRAEVARREPEGGPLSLWLAAITAEHLAMALDPLAPIVATAALASAPPDPLPPMPTAYARARLLRVVSLAGVALPSGDGAARSRDQQDEAVHLLLRYGLRNEVAVTCAMGASVRAVWMGEDPEGCYELLLDARTRFPARSPSLWTAMLDFGMALVSVMRRDVPGALAAIERLEPAAPGGLPGAFPAQGRSYLRLLTEPCTPELLDEALAAADATADPHYRGLYLRHVAGLLADLGRPEAGRFVRPALALPGLGPLDQLERRLLGARIDTLEGRPPAVAGILEMLDALAAQGRPRPAASLALGLAHDCYRTGAADTAAVLHAWGRAHLPEAAQRTKAEAIAARPLGQPLVSLLGPEDRPAVPAREPALRLDVLRPALEIRRHGTPLSLPLTATTLLVALAHAHPLPLHAEAVSDILWPDRALRPNRLNTLVHRVRTALGDAADAVVRDGPMIRLDERRCQVDLWDHRRLLQGSDAERVEALAGVRGNLCEAQLPYNEHLIDARRQFLGEWLHHAEEVLRRGHAVAVDLAAAAAALGAGDELVAWRHATASAAG